MPTLEEDSLPMLPPSPIIDRCKTGVLTPLAFLAGTKLDIFTELSVGPKSADELASAMSIDPDWMRPLLFALAASGLLAESKGTFRNSDEADYFLVRGRPHFIGDISKLFEDLWRGAFLAAESVKAGKPLAAHDYMEMSDEAVSAFFLGQHPDAQLTGWKLADTVDFSGERRLVDVGGGSGGISIALCEHFPDLCATVVELPAVAKVAARYMAESAASARLDAVSVDLLASPLHGNYDVAVMRSLLQVLGPSDCERVLRNVRPGLAPGAKLYVIGQIVDDDRLNPENVALFNLVFLSFYEQGRAHSEADHRNWLHTAGFIDIEREITPNGLNMITASVPG
jgi:hypothetical protein